MYRYSDIMATIFALNHLGAKFQVKLTDCVDDVDLDVSSVIQQSIIFTKPNGTKIEKVATLEEESGEFFITYINTDPDVTSILDLIGNWSYQGKVKLSNDDEFSTSQKFIFWVS